MANRTENVSTNITPQNKKRLERVANQIGLKKSDILRMGALQKIKELDPEKQQKDNE